MDIVLVGSDGECRIHKSSIPDILSSYPRGVYTTMYVDACGKIEDTPTHIRRLEMSIDAVNKHCNEYFGEIKDQFDSNGLRDHIEQQMERLSGLALAKSSLVESHGDSGKMIVFCICPGNLHQASGGGNSALGFSCMVAPYSRQASQKSIKAMILGGPRKVPVAKEIGWVSERKYLQNMASKEFGEILLCKENGELLEGLVTNFFVVRQETRDEKVNAIVQTAPVSSGVVWGTARKHVLEICIDLGVQVDESCPIPAERDTWTEAFVTNSLRKVQPIESIQCSDKNVFGLGPWSKRFEKCPGQLTKHIMHAMNRKLQ